MNNPLPTMSLLAQGVGNEWVETNGLEEKTLANDRPSGLVEAVSGNQVAAVAQLLGPTSVEEDPSWVSEFDGDTALTAAADAEEYSCSLLDDLGDAALIAAASAGDESTVALLLAKRPDLILALDSEDRTALHYAAENGHVNVVRQLLDCKHELIDVVGIYKSTALHVAAEKGHVNIVKLLLDRKPEWIGVVNDWGATALHSAAQHGSIEVIDYLLEQSPQLSDVKDSRGRNALHKAAERGHGETFLKLLAQNPRSIDVVAEKNTLCFAARGANPQVLEAVLSMRPEFACAIDFQGNTALHHLCESSADGHEHLQSYLERIWLLNPSALQTMNAFSETPFILTAYSSEEWGIEFFKRKLSWDELERARYHHKTSLPKKLQVSRVFAEEQFESALSSVLRTSDLIDIVKDYFFTGDVPRSWDLLLHFREDQE